MELTHVIAASFSPTGNTAFVVNLIAERIAHQLHIDLIKDDFTLPKHRQAVREYDKHTLLIIGLPTYAGRIPNKILPFIQEHFKGNQTLTIPVVTFGNRSIDESLKELCLEMDRHGFTVLAGAGIVTEHVFSDKLATGRPNEQDISDIHDFADSCVARIINGTIKPLTFYKEGPIGDYYKPLGIDGKPVKFLKAKPMTDTDLCIKCNICVDNCPMASIDSSNPANVPGICIKCQACIKKCPKHAKYFDNEAFLSHTAMLVDNYERRTESVFYI